MTLTKEDLDAIKSLIHEEFEVRLEPIREEQTSMRKMFTTVINLQVEITDKIEVLDGQIKLIMMHLNLSPDLRKHRDILKKLQ